MKVENSAKIFYLAGKKRIINEYLKHLDRLFFLLFQAKLHLLPFILIYW